MTTTENITIPTIPTYPARPVNGGPLDKAQPKHGEWYYEPKYNGWRTLIHTPTGTMFNREGKHLSIAGEFTAALAILKKTSLEWVDCEALERRHGIGRGSLIVLDYIPEPLATYRQRRSLLELSCAVANIRRFETLNLPLPDSTVALTMTYQAQGALHPIGHGTNWRGLWDLLKQCNAALGCEFYEGVVAKRADSIYPTQLRSPGLEFPFWMKHRWAF